MGWYFTTKTDDIIGEKCGVCGRKIEVDQQIYYIDFAANMAEHFLCYWRRVENEK